MIKHLGPLFIALLASAESNHYLLPDQNGLFERRLSQAIAQARTEVRLLTPVLNHPAVRKATLSAARRGVNVTLIVADPKGNPLSMIAYSGITLRIYPSRPLEGSLVIIDDTLACSAGSPLDKERMGNHAANVLCSDDPMLLRDAVASFETIQRRSAPYLKH